MVARALLPARKDVETFEKRRQRDPQTKPKARERDAVTWPGSESMAPFTYRWCCKVLS
jgi:hypothetical protein